MYSRALTGPPWNMPVLMKELVLWWIVFVLISSGRVLYSKTRRSVCWSSERTSSQESRLTSFVLFSLSGQKKASGPARSRSTLHSGVFCTFSSLSIFSKQPQASTLTSVPEKENSKNQNEDLVHNSILTLHLVFSVKPNNVYHM